jgi:glycine/D-amino acid oxidase-like deaminating enzyme
LPKYLRPVVALSYWHDSLEPGDSLEPRPPLTANTDADVAVIGAGFTGLWTAHSLLKADPSIRVVVLERETAGFGASGRNGGWCVGDYGGPEQAVAKAGGPAAVEAMAREMHRAVDDVGMVVADADIDCGYYKGGALYIAVNDGQLRRVRKHHAELVAHGLGDAWTLLGEREAAAIVHATGIRGGLITPHAAAVHPARLARGLAREVERLGGVIHERTFVRSFERGAVRADGAVLRADVVVLGTEAYTRTIDGHHRDMLPLGNQVIATEPIPDSTWSSIGLANRELFEYASNLLGYGQRTADGRIVWGGLSASYKWNMGIPASPTVDPRIAKRLQRTLGDLFPELRGIGVSHRWGGVLGVPRDLLPGIGYDREQGFAWGGGYTGQGVAAANAAGRGLADLIRDVDSDLVHLPWVGHRSRPWESEPRPWLGVHAVAGAAHVVDQYDRLRR